MIRETVGSSYDSHPFTLEDFLETVERLHRQVEHGCGNHGCVIEKPEGMATNAGCKCQPSRIARDLRRIADRLESSGTEWKRRKL